MYYFTVLEPNADLGNVGTIAASTKEELIEKLTIACAAHFDAETEILSAPDLQAISRGEAWEVRVRVYQTDDPWELTLDIQQTWIY